VPNPVPNHALQTLRIAGPAVWTSPRTVSKDTELGDYILPKGTNVIVDIIALQHDADLWHEPYKFDPERFAPENKSSKSASSWLPFGGGQHQCAGMNMSLAEQRVLLSMIFLRLVNSSDMYSANNSRFSLI
jgi:cytochrome P450